LSGERCSNVLKKEPKCKPHEEFSSNPSRSPICDVTSF